MDAIVEQAVTLPNGESVTINSSDSVWWGQNNGAGYISPEMLAPDPSQPRQHYDKARLKELTESVAEVGVRETITVTPVRLCPWAKTEEDYQNCFFLIVSGHRRWMAATAAKIAAVPIKVVVYCDEAEHRMDGSLLNRNRDKLSPLEVGYELVKLRKLGWTLDKISKAYGMATPLIYTRINLTRLDPKILKEIDPSLPRKQRLAVITAGRIGGINAPTQKKLSMIRDDFSDYCELPEIPEGLDTNGRRFFLQNLFLTVIKKRSLNSVRAAEFIREQKVRLTAGTAHARKHAPRARRETKRNIFLNWLKDISQSVVMDWSPADIRKSFEYYSRENMDDLADQMQNAEDMLVGMKKIITKIRDDKKPTHPDVLRALKQKAS